jgi:hypothetical protein
MFNFKICKLLCFSTPISCQFFTYVSSQLPTKTILDLDVILTKV